MPESAATAAAMDALRVLEIIPVRHPRVRPKVAPGCRPARRRRSWNWRRLVVKTREHLVFHRRNSKNSLVWLL